MFSRLFGFSEPPSCSVSVDFAPRPQNEKYRLQYFFPGSQIFIDGSPLSAEITIVPGGGQRIIHQGITVSLVGQIRIKADGSLDQFFRAAYPIAPPGEISTKSQFTFQTDLAVPLPSYYGTHYDTRYLLIVEALKSSLTVAKEVPIYILFVNPLPENVSSPLPLEIGMDPLIRATVLLNTQYIEVSTCILGYLLFSVLTIRIVRTIFQVLRTEIYSNGVVGTRVSSVVCEFDLIDGVPGLGYQIPVRLFLPGVKLWPFPRKSRSNLAVVYSVQLTFIDEEGKSYQKPIANELLRFV
jgi:hypothetical protein